MCCLVAAVVLALAAPVMAQNAPKGDVAASYSVLYDKDFADSSGMSGWFPTGWVVSGAARVTGNLSLVGEVGQNYKPFNYMGVDATASLLGVLGGVRYTGRVNPTVLPFVQLLFGLSQARLSAMGLSQSGNAFATQIGGGADIAVSPKLAVRLQGDYRALRSGDGKANEFRLATGIVYHF
jgi:opacity protein-like surface antigen